MRAIAKDSQHRPASAKVFAQELRDYLAGRMQATVVTPVMPPPRQPPIQPSRPINQDSGGVAPPQRRPVPRPQYVAPPLSVAPTHQRSGLGFGTLLLGLLLLFGMLAFAYFSLTTDWTNFPGLGSNTGAGASPAVSDAPVASTAPAPSPTTQPTGTAQPVVTVPNLIGQVEAAAVQQLEALNLRRRSNPDDPALKPRFDAAPRTQVIEQNPAPGTQVPVGSEVSIVVSLGPEIVEVPDVTGRRVEDAQSALQAVGFTVERQDTPSRTVQAGLVIKQDPQAGGRIPKGETITLSVSAGDVVPFPNVVANGTLLEQAQPQIEAAGFTVVAVDQQGADQLGGNFERFQPNEVVSATANNIPIDVQGKLVPRGASVVIAVRGP
jgi:serine/threonine-protein kinase